LIDDDLNVCISTGLLVSCSVVVEMRGGASSVSTVFLLVDDRSIPPPSEFGINGDLGQSGRSYKLYQLGIGPRSHVVHSCGTKLRTTQLIFCFHQSTMKGTGVPILNQDRSRSVFVNESLTQSVMANCSLLFSQPIKKDPFLISKGFNI
jgi:hypothetical protein